MGKLQHTSSGNNSLSIIESYNAAEKMAKNLTYLMVDMTLQMTILMKITTRVMKVSFTVMRSLC
jgi:hypothetical protein